METKIVMNTSTGEVSRVELTPEEEQRIRSKQEQVTIKNAEKIERKQEKKNEKKALQQKLGLTDEEMWLLARQL